MMKLEENSGSEEQDAGLLEEACVLESHEQPRYNIDDNYRQFKSWEYQRRGLLACVI